MSKATQSELRLARRMSRLGTETAFEVLVKARALEAKGRDIVHLEIGEPDFDTPRNVVDAGVKALQGGWTHYGPSAGLPKLREAVAHDAGSRRGVKVDPSEVTLEAGFTRDVSEVGHYGTGDLEITLSKPEDLERAKPLIQQSYEAS